MSHIFYSVYRFLFVSFAPPSHSVGIIYHFGRAPEIYERQRFASSLNGAASVIVHSRALCVENDKQEKLALCESFGMIM